MNDRLKVLILASAVTPTAYSQGAMASTFYANTEYGYASTQLGVTDEGEIYDLTSSQSMTELTVGMQTGHNLSFEFRAATSVADHDLTVSNDEISVNVSNLGIGFGLDNYYGIYIKYDIPVSDTLRLHASGGYTQLNFSFNNDNESFTESDEDLSFGIGASLYLNRKVALEFDIARLFSKETESSDLTVDVDTVNLGLKFWL